MTYSVLQRSDIRVFNDSFNQYKLSFQNTMHTVKQSVYVLLKDFLSDFLLILLIKTKYKLQVSGFHDLITTDGEPIHTRIVFIIVLYLFQTGVEANA